MTEDELGWMLCTDSTLGKDEVHQLPKEKYLELWTAIGYAWGGSGDSFNLPDLRGYFLRGADGNAGRDPDKKLRRDKSGNIVPGSGIGSYQADAVVSHKHDDSGHDHSIDNKNSATRNTERVDNDDKKEAVVNGDEFNNAPLSIGIGKAKLGNAVALDANGTVKTSSETRPLNAYIHYIIKFKATRPLPLNP